MEPDNVSAIAPDFAQAERCDAIILAEIAITIVSQEVDPGRTSIHFFGAQKRSRMVARLSKGLVRVKSEDIHHHQGYDQRLHHTGGKLLRKDQKTKAKGEEEEDPRNDLVAYNRQHPALRLR